MKKIFTLIEKLLDLCNSCLRISERTNFNLVNWNLLLRLKRRRNLLLIVYDKDGVRSFQIIKVDRRSGDHGEKTSNEF